MLVKSAMKSFWRSANVFSRTEVALSVEDVAISASGALNVFAMYLATHYTFTETPDWCIDRLPANRSSGWMWSPRLRNNVWLYVVASQTI